MTAIHVYNRATMTRLYSLYIYELCTHTHNKSRKRRGVTRTNVYSEEDARVSARVCDAHTRVSTDTALVSRVWCGLKKSKLQLIIGLMSDRSFTHERRE